jgi:hypothetical protein
VQQRCVRRCSSASSQHGEKHVTSRDQEGRAVPQGTGATRRRFPQASKASRGVAFGGEARRR